MMQSHIKSRLVQVHVELDDKRGEALLLHDAIQNENHNRCREVSEAHEQGRARVHLTSRQQQSLVSNCLSEVDVR